MATPEFPDFADFAPFPLFTGRPPKTRKRPVVAPTGPRLYRMGQKPHLAGVGPGEPPVGFLTAHNSKDEWWVYWAFSKVTGSPDDPRQPPFVGGETWRYQVPEAPTDFAQDTGHIPGGSVSDFVILGPRKATVVRLVTERWHVFAHANVQMRDLFIRDHLRGIERVIDIYSSDFIHDESGDAVCRIVALAIKGIELPSPIRYRSAVRVRGAA